MKNILKRAIRGEKGQTMIMALVLLAVGGLIIAPLLVYMSTALISGEVYDRRTAELYAADAGVVDAVWKIRHKSEVEGPWPCNPSSPPLTYNISDVNGKRVEVAIYAEDENSLTYRIVSIAVTDDGGGTAAISGTQIEAYITAVSNNYSGILDNVITSQNEITIQPGSNVTPPEGEHGPAPYYEGPWPTPEQLAEFYGEDVEGLASYLLDTINLVGIDRDEGPLYRDGELDIKNSSKTPATLTLTGTLYITGDTLIGKNGKDTLTLDLNGQTIFVESSSADPQKALWIGGKCTIIGPGAIIAVGDVYFEPNIPVGMTDPIFIMSVIGETFLQPGGDFYGAIAGSVEVQLQPHTSLNYPEGGFGDINFPGCTGVQELDYGIASWEISQQ